MKLLSLTKTNKKPSEGIDNLEIDVTPVMNMFVILIPFLVSMAVFTHLSIIKLNLPPNVGLGLNNKTGKPKLKITVVVASDHILITHGDKILDSIPNENNEYNYSSFLEKLVAHRQDIDLKKEAIIAVKDVVKFKYVVTIMDQCRGAGFEKVGLSHATEDVEKGV